MNLSKLLDSEDLKPEERSVPIEIRAEDGSADRSRARLPRKPGIFRGVNKLLLAATVFTAIAGLAAFFLIEPDAFMQQQGSVPIAKPANVENTPFGKYFTDTKTTSSTFYLTTKPEWHGLTPAEKKQILKSVFEDAKKRNMRTASILDGEGKPIAYASDTRLEVNE